MGPDLAVEAGRRPERGQFPSLWTVSHVKVGGGLAF